MSEIVKRLRVEIERRGLSQVAAAKSLQVGLRTLHRWMRDEAAPSPLAALAIASWIDEPAGTKRAQRRSGELADSRR